MIPQEYTRVTNWQGARHGSPQLNNEKMQIRENDQGAHFLVFVQLCESRTAEHGARSEAAKEIQKDARRRAAPRRKAQYKHNAQFLRLSGLHSDVNDAHRAGAESSLKQKTKTCALNFRTATVAATLPAPAGQGKVVWTVVLLLFQP